MKTGTFMKRVILAIFCLSILSTHLSAQKKKEQVNTPSAEEYISLYWFEKAEEVLAKERKALARKRKPTTRQDSLQEEIDRLRIATHSTERVVVIDSIVVDNKDLLSHLTLSEESGKIILASTFFENPADTTEATVFLPEIGAKIYFAKPDSSGLLKLYSSDYIDRNWQEHHLLAELDNDTIQNYPFALADGLTLYYAAKGEDCIGGYDIFVTRYDTDENRFLQPENMGMPFNSPANDYMMAIDEINNLGWFVTDRNQPEGKVCIYIFVPNHIRKVYDKHLYSEEELGNLARLHSIAETWGDKEAAREGKERLSALRKTVKEANNKPDFLFILNDTVTITSYAECKSTGAVKLLKEWRETDKELQVSLRTLKMFREGYRNGDEAQRKKLTPHILEEEKRSEILQNKLNETAKAIRSLELGMRGI